MEILYILTNSSPINIPLLYSLITTIQFLGLCLFVCF